MEEYIGKLCPYCKVEIREGDNVKVCPECGVPHHFDCWIENKGCTTFGCSMRMYEEQLTAPAAVCANCGAPLGDGQDFCTNCGTPKNAPQRVLCVNCGTELEDGQAFCPKCGQKAEKQLEPNVESAISQFNADVENKKKKNKKKIIIICAAVFVVVLAAVLFLVLHETVESYMASGDYEKAYSKADEEEKASVVAESAIAVCSRLCTEKLIGLESFDLREAYYEADAGYVVLRVAANNKSGNSILKYWLFMFDDDTNEFFASNVVSDLEAEKYKPYGDADEQERIAIDNLTKLLITNTMETGVKLSSEGVQRINELFATGLLQSVALLPVEYKDAD